MSTESSVTSGNGDSKVESLFGDLPSEVSGWVRHERRDDNSLFEYWKKGSTHITGAYEQIVAQELRDGELRVGQRVYDQFNHLVTSQNLSEQPKDRADRIWLVAKKRMEKFPANETFDNPPEMPTAIGDWELVAERLDQPADITKWEYPFGEAEFIVEQRDIISYYSHTKRPHEIRYRELDSDDVTVVTDITRVSAFEIAAKSMQSLTKPLSEMEASKEQLQSVKGIGPAKSQDLILLGITSPSELATYVTSDSHPVNHHHTTAVEKLLTETIREDLQGRR